ncbi:Nuclear import receptor [Rhizophlyctis rosea]|nr:Nuclear import receptor [Rhizophlyctis rosea]
MSAPGTPLQTPPATPLPGLAATAAPPTVEQVLQVHSVLITGDVDHKRMREADHWLRNFQKTVEYDLYQLDVPGKLSLRDNLITLLHKFRAGPKKMIIQLALSLADLAIQVHEWQTPVQQLVQAFGKDPEMVACLLEFLAVLPEEIMYNRKIKLEREELIARADVLLTQTADEICALLVQYLQVAGKNPDIVEGVLRTFRSWLKSKDMKIQTVIGTPVVDFAFNGLNDDSLSDYAVDVVIALISRSANKPVDQALVRGLYARIVTIANLLDTERDDFDKMRGLTNIFAEAGEMWVGLIVADPQGFSVVVEGMLKCAACEELEVVKETFQFWFLLADEIVLPDKQAARAACLDVFARVLDVMMKHLQYPTDLNSLTASERDDFRDFRHQMGDVLKDCVRVLGATEALARPMHVLTSFFVPTKPGELGVLHPSTPWQQIEAPLFALRTMAREVSRQESNIMPRVMAMLPHLPNHPKIKYAAIMVIGRYAEWTNLHQEWLGTQLTYVVSGFEEGNDEELCGAAALSLKYLCQYCGPFMVNYLDQLHPFYLSTSKRLDKEDRREFTEGIAHLVNSLRTPPQILKALQTFVLPIAQRLHEIGASGKPASEEEEVRVVKEAIDLLDQFSIFIRVVKPEIPPNTTHPCVTVLQDVWPVLDALMNTHAHARRLHHSLCRIFVFAMESYRYHLRGLLSLMMGKVVSCYAQTGEASFLWVAKKCVGVYGEDEGEGGVGGEEGKAGSNGRVVLGVVEALTGTTFGILNERGVEDVPDIVEDYFNLVTSLHDTCPLLFLQSPLLPSTFQCALACLPTTHREALTSVLLFVSTLITTANPSPSTRNVTIPSTLSQPLAELVMGEAEKIVGGLVSGLCVGYPMERDVVGEVGRCLKGMCEVDVGRVVGVLEGVVAGIPVEQVDAVGKEAFLKRFVA